VYHKAPGRKSLPMSQAHLLSLLLFQLVFSLAILKKQQPWGSLSSGAQKRIQPETSQTLLGFSSLIETG